MKRGADSPAAVAPAGSHSACSSVCFVLVPIPWLVQKPEPHTTHLLSKRQQARKGNLSRGAGASHVGGTEAISSVCRTERSCPQVLTPERAPLTGRRGCGLTGEPATRGPWRADVQSGPRRTDGATAGAAGTGRSGEGHAETRPEASAPHRARSSGQQVTGLPSREAEGQPGALAREGSPLPAPATGPCVWPLGGPCSLVPCARPGSGHRAVSG